MKGCYSGPDPQPESYQLLVLGQYEVHININTSHFCLPHAPAVVRSPKCVVGVCDAWIYSFLSYIYSYSFLLPLIILLPLSFNPYWDYISFFSFFPVLSFRIFHSFMFFLLEFFYIGSVSFLFLFLYPSVFFSFSDSSLFYFVPSLLISPFLSSFSFLSF